ncbi:MAG TPA: hypothetical protein VMZ00_08865 [Sporichthya sp.]|nr:hypothetical protein [Sporichthya sp.]
MHTPSRRLLAATAALASALFLAGCASDDNPIATPSQPVASQSPTASAAPTIDDFCNAKVAIDAAFLAGGPPQAEQGATPSPQQVGEGIRSAFSAPYAELKRTAQAAVAPDVDQLISLLDAAIASGDGDFMFKPDFAAADKKVDDFLSNSCGFNKISGTAADYEFTGLPSVSPAGVTGLTLTNAGNEFHEMVLMRINDDVTTGIQELFQLSESELNSKIVPMGVVLASPGTTATNFFDVRSGRYAVLCFISKGSTADTNFQGSGPPHFTLGMLAELRVLPGPGEATAAPTSSSSPSPSSGMGMGSSSGSPSPSSGTGY